MNWNKLKKDEIIHIKSNDEHILNVDDRIDVAPVMIAITGHISDSFIVRKIYVPLNTDINLRLIDKKISHWFVIERPFLNATLPNNAIYETKFGDIFYKTGDTSGFGIDSNGNFIKSDTIEFNNSAFDWKHGDKLKWFAGLKAIAKKKKFLTVGKITGYRLNKQGLWLVCGAWSNIILSPEGDWINESCSLPKRYAVNIKTLSLDDRFEFFKRFNKLHGTAWRILTTATFVGYDGNKKALFNGTDVLTDISDFRKKVELISYDEFIKATSPVTLTIVIKNSNPDIEKPVFLFSLMTGKK